MIPPSQDLGRMSYLTFTEVKDIFPFMAQFYFSEKNENWIRVDDIRVENGQNFMAKSR